MQPHFAKILGRGHARRRSLTRVGGRLSCCRGDASPRWRLWQANALQWLQGRERNQLIQNLLSKYLVDALAVAGYWWRHQQGIGRRVQLKMLFRMRQRIVGYERCD